MTRCWIPLVLALAAVAGCRSPRGDEAAPAGQSGAATEPSRTPLATPISTDELARWIEEQRPHTLIDVRTDVFAYLRDHLPGAVYLHTETLRAAQGGVPTQLLEPAMYAALFSRLGIRHDRPVVIYSAGETHNIDATFLAWLLAGFGHPAVHVLDGGYFKWQLEQRLLAVEYPTIEASRFPERPFAPERASLDEVVRAMETGGALLVDARPPEQYAGRAGAQMRRGHIPGAINHYWQDDLEQRGFGRVWKPVEALRASYEAQGITSDREIIAYCNSATEASHVHFTLRNLLGYPRVRVYVGSWTEWAGRRELPVATGDAPAPVASAQR